MSRPLPHERRRSVLRLLAKHGALSIRSIEATLAPRIERKRLWEVLGRLSRDQIISKRFDNLFGNRGVFYEIQQSAHNRHRVGRLLNINPEALTRGVRRFDLLHSESCAVWAEYLECLFPFAKVIREEHYHEHPELASVLLADPNERDFMPDLMVIAPALDPTEKIYLAIEIERSPKTRDRLLRKLRKYADETRIDGLLYVCDSGDIATRLCDVYRASVLKKSIRVGHYAKGFFLFSDGVAHEGERLPKMFNVSHDRVDLVHWMSMMRSVSIFDRRDSNYELQGSHPGPEEQN